MSINKFADILFEFPETNKNQIVLQTNKNQIVLQTNKNQIGLQTNKNQIGLISLLREELKIWGLYYWYHNAKKYRFYFNFEKNKIDYVFYLQYKNNKRATDSRGTMEIEESLFIQLQKSDGVRINVYDEIVVDFVNPINLFNLLEPQIKTLIEYYNEDTDATYSQCESCRCPDGCLCDHHNNEICGNGGRYCD